MTVKQGLKEKNKLVAEIKSLFDIVKTYNSIEEGNPRKYSVVETLEKIEKLTLQLVDLKSKIHRANSPVYDKIFLMAELKNAAKILKSVNCDEGRVNERYGTISSFKQTEIDVVRRDEMVKDLEGMIEKLQDELDHHNATTMID